VLHPRFFAGGGFQFFLDCLGDELSQGDAALGRYGFGAAEEEIRDFQRCFHSDPYYHIYGNMGCSLSTNSKAFNRKRTLRIREGRKDEIGFTALLLL
jgi:hypothetical protein